MRESRLQNRYVGDVGDYAKYGLLRLIANQSVVRVGVVWCLFSNEDHNSDGRHISYLNDPAFRVLDPDLHDRLARIVAGGRRSVKTIARSGILPKGVTFFDNEISARLILRPDRSVRERHRKAWLSEALSVTSTCDVVFFDPDNGLETKSVPAHSPRSGKYMYWDELIPFWERGQSLLIYHHLNRTATVARQTETLKEKFHLKFSDAGDIRYFLFRRGSCRHFWYVSHKNHAHHFRRIVTRFNQSLWREYFEVG